MTDLLNGSICHYKGEQNSAAPSNLSVGNQFITTVVAVLRIYQGVKADF